MESRCTTARFRKTRANVETGGGERWMEPVSVSFGTELCSVFVCRRFNSSSGTFVDGLSTKIAAQTTTETGRHEPLLLKYLLSICMSGFRCTKVCGQPIMTPPPQPDTLGPTMHHSMRLWALAANKGNRIIYLPPEMKQFFTFLFTFVFHLLLF